MAADASGGGASSGEGATGDATSGERERDREAVCE